MTDDLAPADALRFAYRLASYGAGLIEDRYERLGRDISVVGQTISAVRQDGRDLTRLLDRLDRVVTDFNRVSGLHAVVHARAHELFCRAYGYAA